MTQSTDPERPLAAAIRALRHEILSAGRHLLWDDVRGRIRGMIKDGRPSPEERIELLELYDRAVNMAQRRCWQDLVASGQLVHERANDTLLFLLAEVRDQGEVDAGVTMAAVIARELRAGRMELGSYFNNIVALVLERLAAGAGPPPGVSEDGAKPFRFPPPLTPPPASPPDRPWR